MFKKKYNYACKVYSLFNQAFNIMCSPNLIPTLVVVSMYTILVNLLYKKEEKHHLYYDIQTQLHLMCR